jgi:hypothetical protein
MSGMAEFDKDFICAGVVWLDYWHSDTAIPGQILQHKIRQSGHEQSNSLNTANIGMELIG